MQFILIRRTVESAKGKKEEKGQVLKRHDLFTRWQRTKCINSFIVPITDSAEGKWKFFLFLLFYKRNSKRRHSCATIELWMHLGGLLSTQETRVALDFASRNPHASFVLSNLPRASITRWSHAARLPFLKFS